MATIYTATGSAPVKVRDMGSEEALVEGAVIARPGARVQLARGSLNVAAEVVWSRGGRAGLRFETSVSVADWLTTGRVPTPRQRAHMTVQQAKAAAMASEAGRIKGAPVQPSPVTSLELTRLRQAIESLAEDLCEDRVVFARHASKLQTLDLAGQILRKLAAER